jgi:hypothetical protein
MDTRTSMNNIAIVVRLPGDLGEAPKQRAATEDRSVASLLRLAAKRYIDQE